MKRQLLVVYNPKSGSSDTTALRQAMATTGESPKYIPVTSRQLKSRISELVSDPQAIIIAVGGDGTINSVAQHLLGAKCALGIVPAGTLNHFAKALNLPQQIPDAVHTALTGLPQRIDVGMVNKRVFINNSSIGFYPRSLRFRDDYEQHIGKWPAAALGLARTIIRPRKYTVTIEIENKTLAFKTPFIFVGNNEYARSGPGLGERRSLQQGNLALYAVKATRPLAIINSLLHTFLTKKRHARDFTIYTAQSFTIHTHRARVRVACDGESFIAKTPLHFASQPQSLRVVVPNIKRNG